MRRFAPSLPLLLRRTLASLAACGAMSLLAAPALPVAGPTAGQGDMRLAAGRSGTSAVPAKAVSTTPAPPTPDPNAYVIKRALTIDEPIIHGFWKWDDSGVPDGPLIITVDTVAQTMSVFRDGYEIGVAVILYGADEKPTPLGIHRISQKKTYHVSNLYGAPMPYMQRLTDDGVAIHASDVIEGFVTHGCVGIPKEFARRLFAATKIGDQVIITSGEKLSVGAPVAAAKL